MRRRNLGLWIASVAGSFMLGLILMIVLLALAAGSDSATTTLLLIPVLWLLGFAANAPVYVWLVSTHNEFAALGYSLPHRALYFIPIASIYALYKYCEAMEQATGNLRQFLIGFLLAILLHPLALIIYAQSGYNKLAASAGQRPV